MLIVGNLKSYITSTSDFDGVMRAANRLSGSKKHTLLMAAPFPYLGRAATKKSKAGLVAQDISVYEPGAHTGEVTAELLCDLGVSHVLVGHSERRALGEGNVVVTQKVKRAIEGGLSVILAVGETQRDLHGNYLAQVKEDIITPLSAIDEKMLRNITLAYEPVWAIGKSADEAITPGDLEEMLLYIRKILYDHFGEQVGKRIKIIYGGSVNAGNVASLIVPHLDGFLPGRASSTADSLTALIKSINDA